MQHVLFNRRAALELLSEKAPDATKDHTRARIRGLEEGMNVAAEYLTDAFSDHLQRQAVPAKSGDQLGPILVSAPQLLLRQQGLAFGNPQTAEVEAAYRGTAEDGQLRRCLAAGYHQTAFMPRLAHSLQQRAVSGEAV